jgi:hypothetical protein
MMLDGSMKKLGDIIKEEDSELRIADNLIYSWVMDDMPYYGPEADCWEKYKDWSTANFDDFEYTSGWIRRCYWSGYGSYYTVTLADGTVIRCTREEAPYIKRGEEYMWQKIEDLVIGDGLMKHDKTFVNVTSLEFTVLEDEQEVPVITLNVEPNDVMFIEGFCFHNGGGK